MACQNQEQMIEEKAWRAGFRLKATIVGTSHSADSELCQVLGQLARDQVANRNTRAQKKFQQGKMAGEFFAQTFHTPDTCSPLSVGHANALLFYGEIKPV